MEQEFRNIDPKKKQKEHYVPKWYLRNFSSTSDRGYIWAYSTKSKTIKEEPINKIAQKQDFYGKEFEDSLDPIDTRTKLVIENIISNNNVDNLSVSQLDTIYEFFVLQYYRTEHAKEAIEKQLKLTTKLETIPRLSKVYRYIPQKDFETILSEPPTPNFFLINIDMALNSKEAISDLTLYLIKNSTNMPFFTSDDPVVFNNRYHVKNKFLIGFQAPGVQIICPIDQKYSLMLVHQDAYRIKNSGKSLITLKLKTDVDLFNKLQILDSHSQVFSKNNTLGYIQNLHKESEIMRKKIRFDEKIQSETLREIKDYEKIERKNYGVHFSFMERNENFVRNVWPKYLKKTPPSETPFVRNKELYAKVKAKTDLFLASFLKDYQTMLEQKVSQLEPLRKGMPRPDP